MENIKVLVADDEPDVLHAVARKLQREGFQVLEAADGLEAWHKIQTESPDVIVLDLNMPRMDGFTVLRQLRESPPSEKWQPVIIVSARTELEDMRKGFSFEADHYITKPCAMEDILRAIRLMVSLIPHRREE